MAKTNKFSLLTTFTPNNFNIHAHGKLKMLRLSEKQSKIKYSHSGTCTALVEHKLSINSDSKKIHCYTAEDPVNSFDDR